MLMIGSTPEEPDILDSRFFIIKSVFNSIIPMNSLKNLERLQRLHDLIDGENTGSPAELAKKMNISQRLVYNLLYKLRDFEAPIRYSRRSKTYYYNDDFELKIKISVSVLSNDELTEIFAGSYFARNKAMFNYC